MRDEVVSVTVPDTRELVERVRLWLTEPPKRSGIVWSAAPDKLVADFDTLAARVEEAERGEDDAMRERDNANTELGIARRRVEELTEALRPFAQAQYLSGATCGDVIGIYVRRDAIRRAVAAVLVRESGAPDARWLARQPHPGTTGNETVIVREGGGQP